MLTYYCQIRGGGEPGWYKIYKVLISGNSSVTYHEVGYVERKPNQSLNAWDNSNSLTVSIHEGQVDISLLAFMLTAVEECVDSFLERNSYFGPDPDPIDPRITAKECAERLKFGNGGAWKRYLTDEQERGANAKPMAVYDAALKTLDAMGEGRRISPGKSDTNTNLNDDITVFWSDHPALVSLIGPEDKNLKILLRGDKTASSDPIHTPFNWYPGFVKFMRHSKSLSQMADAQIAFLTHLIFEGTDFPRLLPNLPLSDSDKSDLETLKLNEKEDPKSVCKLVALSVGLTEDNKISSPGAHSCYPHQLFKEALMGKFRLPKESNTIKLIMQPLIGAGEVCVRTINTDFKNGATGVFVTTQPSLSEEQRKSDGNLVSRTGTFYAAGNLDKTEDTPFVFSVLDKEEFNNFGSQLEVVIDNINSNTYEYVAISEPFQEEDSAIFTNYQQKRSFTIQVQGPQNTVNNEILALLALKDNHRAAKHNNRDISLPFNPHVDGHEPKAESKRNSWASALSTWSVSNPIEFLSNQKYHKWAFVRHDSDSEFDHKGGLQHPSIFTFALFGKSNDHYDRKDMKSFLFQAREDFNQRKGDAKRDSEPEAYNLYDLSQMSMKNYDALLPRTASRPESVIARTDETIADVLNTEKDRVKHIGTLERKPNSQGENNWITTKITAGGVDRAKMMIFVMCMEEILDGALIEEKRRRLLEMAMRRRRRRNKRNRNYDGTTDDDDYPIGFDGGMGDGDYDNDPVDVNVDFDNDVGDFSFD